MTTIQAFQAWCVLNIGIYFFARHVFNYARIGVDFLKSILDAPEMVINNPLVIGMLKDNNIPSFKPLFFYESYTTNFIMFSLVASAIALVILPIIESVFVFYVIVFVLAALNFNTLVMCAQLMHRKSVIKKTCNHYYNIVESCRLDKERNEQAAEAFQQFANRLQELLNNPDKKEEGDNE